MTACEHTSTVPVSLERVTRSCPLPTHLSNSALYCHALAVPRYLINCRDAGLNLIDLIRTCLMKSTSPALSCFHRTEQTQLMELVSICMQPSELAQRPPQDQPHCFLLSWGTSHSALTLKTSGCQPPSSPATIPAQSAPMPTQSHI